MQNKFSVTIVFFLSLTLLFILLINATSTFAQSGAEEAAITSLSGDVLVLRKDTTQWQPTKPGDVLLEGDSIKTLAGANAKLQFTSGSIVLLKENTSLVIEKLADKASPETSVTKTNLLEGRIKTIIEGYGGGSSFEVKTPNSIAGVRGTIFYVNVVRKEEKILSKNSILDTMLGINLCYAAGEGLVTEIFVEDGTVDFTNLISNESYNIEESQGSSSDDEGNIGEPKDVPLDKQEEWKSGFEFSEGGANQGSGGSDSGDAKKGEKSTVEGDTSSDSGTSGDTSDTGNSDGSSDYDESKDDQNDNNSDEKKGDNGSDVNVGVDVNTDSDSDGVPDSEDNFPYDPAFSKWTDANDANGDKIPDGKEDYQLYEEVRDLYNDVQGIEEAIELAEVQGRLDEMADYKEGKVIKDIHGNRVRLDSYILLPKENGENSGDKVDIVFLSQRRDGSDAGVSSISLEFTFNDNLPSRGEDFSLKTDIPWSDIMNTNRDEENNLDILYSSTPDYYIKSNSSEGFNPENDWDGKEGAGIVLIARNPYGDYLKVYEGFGALEGDRQTWLTPQHNINVNGVFKTASKDWESNGGSGSYSQTFKDNTFLNAYAYVIDDNGNLQDKDYFYDKDGDGYDDRSPEDFTIHSAVRDFFSPSRKYNIELKLEASEFTNPIDVIVAPEVMRPYDQEEELN